jgi:hypothetical protein
MIVHSTRAPEIKRQEVKLAGSMLVCLSAMRQRRELLAKASMAKMIGTIARGGDMTVGLPGI